MQDKHREQRRQKRLEKRRKQRSDVSRPGVGGPTTAIDPLKGRTWAVGDCYASENADEPGAKVELVFARTRTDGTSVVATFELDRSGPGLVGVKTRGGLRSEHITGECAQFSEATGRSMVGCSGSLIATLVDDARKNGTHPEPAGTSVAVSLLEGIPLGELPCPFGPQQRDEPAGERSSGGLWSSLRKRIVGS